MRKNLQQYYLKKAGLELQNICLLRLPEPLKRY
jgi:hypothetical protein